VYYGLVIAFSVLGILAALMTGKVYACRFLMYGSCIVLFLAAFIGFTVALAFTAVLPPLTWSCAYIDSSLQSEPNFLCILPLT
jgi:hypothetical protein